MRPRDRYEAALRLLLAVFGRTCLPLMVGVGLICAVIFGGNGLSPRVVATAWRLEPALRIALVVAWALLSRASVRALLSPPGLGYLRAAPLRRGVVPTASALLVLVTVGTPSVVLSAGGEWLGSVTFVFAAGALACASPRTLPLVAGALLHPLLAPIAFITCFALAYRAAPVRPRTALPRVRALPLMVRLALVHVAALTRDAPGRLLRAFFIAGAFLAWLARSLRDDPAEGHTRALGAVAVVSACTALPLLSTVGRTRRALAPFLRAAGRPRAIGLLAAAIVVGSPSLAFAAGAAVEDRAPFAIAYAFVLGAVLIRLEARLFSRHRDAPVRLVIGALGLMAVAIAAAHSVLATWLLTVLGAATLFLPESEDARAPDA